jgi:hypothetical protein
MAVTPHREVWLEVDGPEQSTTLRPSVRQSWGPGKMGQADGWTVTVNPDNTLQYVTGHINTQYVPGDAWVLQPLLQTKFSLLTGDFPGGLLGPSNFTVAINLRWQQMYRPPTDLPGVGGGGFTTTAPALRRRVPAGQAWDHPNNMLGADQAAYPPPIDSAYPDPLPVDRVGFSNGTFEENMGFGLTFGAPESFWGGPTLFRFYFGGPTLIQPTGHVGGEFCLVVRGSGKAILYEKSGISPGAWQRRMVFTWAAPDTIAAGSHTLVIWPMATDRILFITHVTEQPAGPQGLVMPPMVGGRPGIPTMNLYRDTPGQTGHAHLRAQTGVGKVRLDLLRNHRLPIVPWLLQFPATGVMTDQPFPTAPLAAGTPIELFVSGFGLDGAGVQAHLWAIPVSGPPVALPQDLAGRFIAFGGEQSLYAGFDFHASASRFQTPVLLGYDVRSPALTAVRVTTPVTGKVRDGSVTGPDVFPGHGSASVNIRDRAGVFTILRAHDRRYCRVKVTVPTTEPYGDPRGFVIIHEGETWQPKAQLRGRERLDNVSWFNYQVNMVDLWPRVQKQFNDFQVLNYTRDPDDASLGAVILAVIRDLFRRAGVPDDELDIPGADDKVNGVRFDPTYGMTQEDYLVQPGQNLAQLIKRFAFDTLGKIVIRDPNCRSRGMWRVLDPPQPTFTGDPRDFSTPAIYPLAQSVAAFFVKRPPATLGATLTVIEDEGALDVGTPGTAGYLRGGFVKDGSYFLYPEAPEGTYLTTFGYGELFPGGAANQKLKQFIWNPKAVDWDAGSHTADPTSISYMDRWEPASAPDRQLNTQLGVNRMTAHLARQLLNGRLWCEFTAPLLFINDPADAILNEDGPRKRPLRCYDQVSLYDEHGNPHPVMLRNVNPFWTSSRIMWMHVQGLFLDAH